jgi:dTDP-4-amino-4,6-dideoxygalactose transaminase
MASVKRICDRYGAILLEDCVQSLGVRYADIHAGHMGVACAISSQSYKMINSGEGGFLLTDNEGTSQQEQETWKRLGS